jgi:hypothetical protein
MNVEFVGLIVSCAVLAVVLAAYERLMRKYKAIRSSQEEIETKARDKAVRIIEEARDKAILILNEANLSAGNNQQELENKLNLVAEKQVDVYKEMLQKISKSIEDEALDEITDFKKELETEVVGSEKMVTRKIDEELLEVNKQIDAYKAEKIREFDTKAGKLVREFLRISTGMVFEEADHKELIKQALEEAKKDNVI